jgi:FMN phosphatase YigB (HAD superfamily)
MKQNTETISLIELIKELKQMIDQSRLPRAICFDYFDTLVFRTVPPEHTKVLAAHQLSKITGILSGGTIYEIRQALERKLCVERHDQGKDPEFSLTELAKRFYVLLTEMSEGKEVVTCEQKFINIFCNIEVAVEKQVQRPYQEMIDFLGWLKERSVTTCLISDFYIPLDYFQAMLRHHGFDDLFSEIFISVDYGVTKGSGKLYDAVSRRFACDPADLWMIGDNSHADRYMAEHAGLKAYLLDVSESNKAYKRMSAEIKTVEERNLDLRQACNRLVKGSSGFPFPEMALTLWSFISSLFDHLSKNKVRDVFFCSKEGEFLKKLFETYQEKMFGAQLISSHYLVVSRKATFICSLYSLEKESFSRLFDQYRDLTIEEFILSLNFSNVQLNEIKNQLPCDCNVRIADLQQSAHFQTLVNLPLFRELYEQHRRIQRHNFLCYLNSFGIDFEKNGLHLVDVGWKGSIQNNIYFTLQEVVHVHGYYLGLLTPSCVTEKNSKTGILFSDFPKLTPFVHVYNNNRSLFEMVLGASHGSADGYFTDTQYSQVKKSRCSSVLQRVKGEENVVVTVLDLPEERRLFAEKIYPLQLEYFSQFQNFIQAQIHQYCPLPDGEWFAKHHARMLFKPRKEEVDFFARLYHLENFGLFEFTTFTANESHIFLWRRLDNFLTLWRNPAGVLETGVWPPIIFRRLGLSWLQKIDGMKRYRRIFLENQ